MSDLIIRWEHDRAKLDGLVAFFVQQVSSEYISHGEVLSQRADNFERWSDELPSVLHSEFGRCFDSMTSASQRIAVAERDGGLVGLAFVEMVPRVRGNMAILSDLVVASADRGHGLGITLLTWVEEELARLGVGTLLLESGVHNHRAHGFFKRHGYDTTSVIMAKSLKRG